MANKFLKRTLSVIMCVALIASMFAMSVSVLAEEAGGTDPITLEFDLTTYDGYNKFVSASKVLTTRVTNASITKGDDGLKYKDASDTKQAMPIAYMPITLPEGSEQQGFELAALKSDKNTEGDSGQYIPGPSLFRQTLQDGKSTTYGFYFMIKNDNLFFRAAYTGREGNTWDWVANTKEKDYVQGSYKTADIYSAKYVVTKDGEDGEVNSTNQKNILYSIVVTFLKQDGTELFSKTIKLNTNNQSATGGDINGKGDCAYGSAPFTITTTYGIAFGTAYNNVVSSTQTVKSATLTYTGTEAHIHSWSEWDVTAQATCTAAGSRTRHCTDENCPDAATGTQTEEISALGHDWNDGEVTTAATCTVKGEKTYTCSRCTTTKTEEIATIDHTYDEGAVTKDPNCTETGVKTYTCTVCSDTKTEEIPANGHDWNEWVVTKKAEKTEKGLKTRTCKNGDATETEEIPATGSIALKYNSNPDTENGEKSFNDFVDTDANHAVANTNNKFLEVNADGTMQVKGISGSKYTGFYSILDNQGTVKSFEVKSTVADTTKDWYNYCNGTFLGIVFDKEQDANGNAVYLVARFSFKGDDGKPCIQVLAMQPNTNGNYANVLSCSNYNKKLVMNYKGKTYATLNSLNSSYTNNNLGVITGVDYSVHIDNGETVIRATFNLKNGETPYSEYVLNADNINNLAMSQNPKFSDCNFNYNNPVFGIAKVNCGNTGSDVIINEITAKYDRPTTEEIEDFRVSSAQVTLDQLVKVKITVTDTNKRFKAAYTKDFGVRITSDIVKEFSNSNGDFTPNSTYDEYTCVLQMPAQDMSKVWTITPYLIETDDDEHTTASLKDYSVKQNLTNLSEDYADNDAVMKQVYAVANYSAAAEKYFNVVTADGTYSNSFLNGEHAVDLTAYESYKDTYKLTWTPNEDGNTDAGASLKITDKIALVYYMENETLNGADVTFVVDDVEYTVSANENGIYRLETDPFNLTAADLGATHKVVIKSGETVLGTIEYSGYAYICRMASKSRTSDELKTLLNAIVELAAAATTNS